MQRKHLKKLVVGGALLASLGLMAGCEKTDAKVSSPETEAAEIFESVDVTVDVKNREITLSGAVDSLVVGSLESLGGSKYFIATDDDPVDPDFDWDAELKEGSVIKFGDGNVVRIVVLDDENRTVAVWVISYPVEQPSEEKSSSSSKKDDDESESSSSEEVEDDSSSSEAADDEVSSSSAEEEDESSSSEEPVEESSSSEETAEESSSSEEAESSSSEEPVVESSSSEEVAESSSSEEVVVSSSSEQVEPESSSSSEESVESSSSEEVVESSSSEEMVESSSSAANEPQLPGTSFDSWDKSFWGSTSDAMATTKTSFAIKLQSSANATFSDSKMTLTSKVVGGSFIGIEGSWKLAGGFYFAGSYSGTTALDIYEQGYSGGTPDDTYASDLSKDMTFGRPFSARPVSFDVTYSYKHVAGKNSTYPQQGLIYVVLVSDDNKIVAAGSIIKTASSELTKETVELQYGSDAGLLGKSFAGVKNLELGTGKEDVASIRVMFASSAYAFVADGGILGKDGLYRGGEGSQLTIDEFKLNY